MPTSQNTQQDKGSATAINYCPFCAAKTIAGARFCISCGKNLEGVTKLPSKELENVDDKKDSPSSSPTVTKKPDFNEDLAAIELITRSGDRRKNVAIFAGPKADETENGIVLIGCPSCKTMISSSADRCYSCGSIVDRKVADTLAHEQRKLLEEKKKEELKKKREMQRQEIQLQKKAAQRPPEPEVAPALPAYETLRPVEKPDSTKNVQGTHAHNTDDSLPDGLMKCPSCGTHISSSASVCYSCHKRFREDLPPPPPIMDNTTDASPEPAPTVPAGYGRGGLMILCDQGHAIECDPANIPRACPTCGSKKLTFMAGKLKENKGGMFGKRGGVTQVTFKSGNDRMEELDKKYGGKW